MLILSWLPPPQMCEEEERRLMDSSSLPPPLQPSLSYVLPEENHLEGLRAEWHEIEESCDFLLMVKRICL